MKKLLLKYKGDGTQMVSSYTVSLYDRREAEHSGHLTALPATYQAPYPQFVPHQLHEKKRKLDFLSSNYEIMV